MDKKKISFSVKNDVDMQESKLPWCLSNCVVWKLRNFEAWSKNQYSSHCYKVISAKGTSFF